MNISMITNVQQSNIFISNICGILSLYNSMIVNGSWMHVDIMNPPETDNEVD